MEKPDFDAVADAVIKHALWVIEAPKERWHAKTMWKDGDPAKAKPAPYEPTGHATFDKLVTALNPCMHYGGSPMNTVRGDWVIRRDFAQLMDLPFMPDDHDAVFIVMPHKADFTGDDAYTSTVAHELFHWWEQHVPTAPISAGLKDASAPATVDNGVDPAYIMEECAAELGSALLMAATGVDPNTEERGEYLAGYLNSVPPQFRDEAIEMTKKRAKIAVEGMLAKVSK